MSKKAQVQAELTENPADKDPHRKKQPRATSDKSFRNKERLRKTLFATLNEKAIFLKVKPSNKKDKEKVSRRSYEERCEANATK